MPQCTVPECGKEFKDNAGLASHMGLVHNLARDGTPLPETYLEERKSRIREGQQERHRKLSTHRAVERAPAPKSGWHSPAARVKANRAIATTKANKKILAASATAEHPQGLNAYYVKLALDGIHRCPECSRDTHKTVDFPSAKELGKHRRFKHNVLGRKHHKKADALSAPVPQTKEAVLQTEETTAITTSPVVCSQCSKTFRSAHGLAIHISQAHKVDPHGPMTLPLQPAQELIHGNGSTQGTAISFHEGRGLHRHIDAALVTTLAVDKLSIHFENNLSLISHEHNLPPRDLAKWFLVTLGKRYAQDS